MDAAIATEALKLRRSPVARTGWLTVVLGVPALTAALTAAARTGGDSQLAVKAAAMLTGTGLAGYLGIVGQVTTVAMLVTTGIVTAWCFGREFVDGTVAGLFAATMSRRRIASAKFAVMILWSLTACAATVLVALLAGALLGGVARRVRWPQSWSPHPCSSPGPPIEQQLRPIGCLDDVGGAIMPRQAAVP